MSDEKKLSEDELHQKLLDASIDEDKVRGAIEEMVKGPAGQLNNPETIMLAALMVASALETAKENKAGITTAGLNLFFRKLSGFTNLAFDVVHHVQSR